MGNRRHLDLLWGRLEDAKQELDRAHQQVAEVRIERISTVADRNHAHTLALRAHDLAVKNYLKALDDLKATLPAVSQNGPEPPNPNPDGLDGITNREKEVLILIASGKTSKEIAAELGIAFRTAVCHRYRLYQKLRVHTSVELTRAALRMGLIEL